MRLMARSCWLAKSEPSTYAWERLVAEGSTRWDGVRNFQARNNLQAMKKGDAVLFYHSGKGSEVVGIARVTREAYPDPTAREGAWVAVDLEPIKPLRRPVGLAQIKADAKLRGMALVRQSRLSVMPVSPEEFDRILELGETKLR
jgi:predicted RNA-binding protein with PUA-like domain